MNFRIDLNLIEYRQVSQSAEKFTGQDGLKVDYLLCAIVKVYAQRIRSFDPERLDSVDWVIHSRRTLLVRWLIQRFDWPRRLTFLEPPPIVEQLSLM
jgi:hypothetical protein